MPFKSIVHVGNFSKLKETYHLQKIQLRKQKQFQTFKAMKLFLTIIPHLCANGEK